MPKILKVLGVGLLPASRNMGQIAQI